MPSPIKLLANHLVPSCGLTEALMTSLTCGVGLTWLDTCAMVKRCQESIYTEATSNTKKGNKTEHKPDVFRHWAARKIAIIIAHTRKYGMVKPQNANNRTRLGTLSSVCIFDSAQKVAKWENFLTGLNRDCSKATGRRYFNMELCTPQERSHPSADQVALWNKTTSNTNGMAPTSVDITETKKDVKIRSNSVSWGAVWDLGLGKPEMLRPLSNRAGWRLNNFELILANQLN